MDEQPAQADSSRRPLRRRAATIARPARVRIRNRKPCVFARRRLFGWNVRLLTVGLHRYGGQALNPDDRVGAVCNPRQGPVVTSGGLRVRPVNAAPHRPIYGTDHSGRRSNRLPGNPSN
jgi:hypothetical protein